MKSRRQKQQQQERYASARKRAQIHDSGGITCLKIPRYQGNPLKFWKPEKGNNRIDIIPFRLIRDNEYAKAGQLYFEQTYYNHRSVGANNKSYCCPAEMKGKKCPICKYRQKISEDPDADEKLEAKLKVKQRQIFLIRDHKNLGAGLFLWDIAYPCFGKLLDQMINEAEEDEREQWDRFFSLGKDGSTLRVVVEEKQGGGYKFLDTTAIQLKPRENRIKLDINEIPCLQDCPIVLKSERLAEIFGQGLDDEDGEDENDDEFEDFDKGEFSVTTPKKGAKVSFKVKGKKHTGVVKDFDDDQIKIKSDKDGKTYKIDEDDDDLELLKKGKGKSDDDDDDDEDDEDEKPKKGKKAAKKPAKKAKKSKKEEDEEDEDEDEDDDDESDDDEDDSDDDSDDSDDDSDDDDDDDDDDSDDDDDDESELEDDDEDDDEDEKPKKGKKGKK